MVAAGCLGAGPDRRRVVAASGGRRGDRRGLRVELELPGIKQENISVELSGGELAVSGEVEEGERVITS
jgi:HSP20 family molecular chaperone IbpA